MEIFILKSCLNRLHGRIRLPSPSFLNFFRQEHLSPRVKNEEAPKKLSTLYVPKRYGGIIYQIVKPRLDVEFIERNIAEIEKSCQLRGIEFNKESSIPLFKEWEDLENTYSNILAKDKQYREEKKECASQKLTAKLETITKEHNFFIENTLKAHKSKLYDLEDIVIPMFQIIPNTISPLTPSQDVVEKNFGTPSDFELASHVEVGKNMGMLEFSNVSPSAYYLTGKFSELEMCIQDYFFNTMLDLGFSPISGTDFCKSFIIEAIGLDPYSVDDCIPLQSKDKQEMRQKLNLVGGGSFESFCAYLTNMNISKNILPFSYFSLGRCYVAKHRNVSSPDLFSVVQSSNIQLLVLSESEDDSKFDELFQKLVSIYEAFGVPFRTVNIGAVNLNATERRRQHIELWSPSCQKYIPVSWLSCRGDFVAKRLNATYGEEYAVDGYCYMVEGVGVNVPVLIGCIVENLQKSDRSFDFPEVLCS